MSNSADAPGRTTPVFDIRFISTENRVLSSAGNTGCQLTRREVAANFDERIQSDRDWLENCAWLILTKNHAWASLPSIAPIRDGEISDCKTNPRRNPAHVLRIGDSMDHTSSKKDWTNA